MGQRRAVGLRRRRRAVPTRVRGAAHPSRAPVRPAAGGPHVGDSTRCRTRSRRVYETMLPRQPLRFLLADDPGAGKTIMAGLLIKELIRPRRSGALPHRLPRKPCRSVAGRALAPVPARFPDPDPRQLARGRTGNWFRETDLVIARLDKLSRDPDAQRLLQASGAGWDLVVFDEAHKLSRGSSAAGSRTAGGIGWGSFYRV